MSVVFIALGANLGNPLKQAQDAIESIHQLPSTKVIQTSPFYRSKRLTIPHYDMKNREFVLYPLYDLDPQLILPDQTRLSDLLINLPLNNMTHW